jgi:hypothetical protein
LAQQAADRLYLLLPAYEVRRLDGQVIRASIESVERGEVGWETSHDQLENMLGPLEVFEAVLSHIRQSNAHWKGIANEGESGLSQEDLTPMSSREKASHPVEDRANIVVSPLLGGAGV